MKYKFCSNCGKKIKATAQFCPHCGAKQGTNHIQRHNNFGFNQKSINQSQNILHKIGNFFSSHIYHIPTADFSHSRLIARKTVSIIYIILMVFLMIPVLFELFTGNFSIGEKFIEFLITIIELLIFYLVVRWLFNIAWMHFWKTWSIKKVIVIAVVLVCVGGATSIIHSKDSHDISDEQITNFKKSADNDQWKIGVGNYSNGKLQVDSTENNYSMTDGSIIDDNDSGNQANYHIDGDTITLSNLNNAVSGMNVPYNQLVDDSTNDQSTKAVATNDIELLSLAKKMFKQPSTNDVIVFKASSGQGISSHNLLIFIKA